MFIKDVELYRTILSDTPGVRILGIHNAFAFTFLHELFRTEGLNGISQADFTYRLKMRLSEITGEVVDEDDILEEEPDETEFPDQILQKRAKKLTERWISPEKGFLIRIYDKESNPYLQPEPSILFAFSFIEDIRGAHHIGVESSFEAICRDMTDLVANTATDPEEAIRVLKEQRDECDRKIKEISESKDRAVGYSEERKGERITALAKSMRNFIGTMPQIRQNFMEILDEMRRRDDGSLDGMKIAMSGLGMTLDLLDNTEQGKSYNAFFRLIGNKGSRMEFSHRAEQIVGDADQEKYRDECRIISNFIDDVLELNTDINHTIGMIADRIVHCMDRPETRTYKAVDSMATQLLSNISIENMDDLCFTFDTVEPPNLPMDRTLKIGTDVYRKVTIKEMSTPKEQKEAAIEKLSGQVSVNPEKVKRELLEYANMHEGKARLSGFMESRGKVMGIAYVTETISYLMTWSKFTVLPEKCSIRTRTCDGEKTLTISDIEGDFIVSPIKNRKKRNGGKE